MGEGRPHPWGNRGTESGDRIGGHIPYLLAHPLQLDARLSYLIFYDTLDSCHASRALLSLDVRITSPNVA